MKVRLLFVLSVAPALAASWPAASTSTDISGPLLAVFPAFEPSGMVWHAGRESYILVSDAGDVAEIAADGTVIDSWSPGHNWESITVADPYSSIVYLGDENRSEIYAFDLDTGALDGDSWSVSAYVYPVGILGFEALAWVPDGYHAYGVTTSGGLFYVGWQYDADMYVFEPDLSTDGSITYVDQIRTTSGYNDLSDLYFSEATGTLFAVYDGADRLEELETAASAPIATYRLPETGAWEGVAVKDDCATTGTGTMALGDDAGGIHLYTSFPLDCLIVDADGDGLNNDVDCDDSDATVWTEETYYADADGDGYGDPAESSYSCAVPAGFLLDNSDCDDGDPDTSPSGSEVCDAFGADEDCDTLVNDGDPSVSGTSPAFADLDGDGFGEALGVLVCEVPIGYSPTTGDCDDTASGVNPGAAEVCDAGDLDEDCDGVADDADASVEGQVTTYADLDADGYGAGPAMISCDTPAARSTAAGDCDDAEAAISPAAIEVCDAGDTDEDCDGAADDTDPSATGQDAYFLDSDGDSYGVAAVTYACEALSGYTTRPGDCDDTLAVVNPAADERCDPLDVDEDCDGAAEDADASVVGQIAAYEDSDADGYGGTTTLTVCDLPAGYAAAPGDCDDSLSSINPAAQEVCDDLDVDEDCDGLTDDASAGGQTTYYRDADGDGFGFPSSETACEAPSGYASVAGDCDDADPGVNPSAVEGCDAANVDEDCDGRVDEADDSVVGLQEYYVDADGDAYGSSSSTLACDLPKRLHHRGGDCNDRDAAINPAAAEVCDRADEDEDCDGQADDADSAPTGRTFSYEDVDGDGYGAGARLVSCDPAAGSSANGDDCDDADSSISPAAAEVCDALNIDEECDGLADDADAEALGKTAFYADSDLDGYGSSETVDACDLPEAGSNLTGDCDDADEAVYPGAVEEVGDSVDGDCDGQETCYADADTDGYRPDGETAVVSEDLDCEDPGEAGETAPAGDCNDADLAFHPGAAEANCEDPNDYNCDGSVGQIDEDEDGFVACEDCDDAAVSVNPDGVESCNGRDDDCDGEVDEDSVDATTWYPDVDDDGYTDATAGLRACSSPDGYFPATPADCDDNNAGAFPGAIDLPDDGIDQNCDGSDVVTEPTASTDSGTVGTEKEEGGCGCHSGPTPLAWAGPGVALLLLTRRRRRSC